MNLQDLTSIVTACIISAGGVGAVVWLAVKCICGIIAERMAKDYEEKLDEKLEKLKYQLGKKQFVSKTRFEAEFRMYQELSEKNLSMVYCAGESVMIVRGQPYSDEEINQFMQKYCDRLNDAEITNKRYAPFIAKEVYEKYLSLEKEANEIFRLLRVWNQYLTESGFAFTISNKTYHTQSEVVQAIEEKQKILSDDLNSITCELRDYLCKLDVLED